MQPATIATITDVDHSQPHKIVRAACTLKTIELASRLGYRIITVDAGSSPDYVDAMRALGAEVFPQAADGMGNAQRQVLELARKLTPEEHAIIWTESEKYTLIDQLGPAVEQITAHGNDLVMLERMSLDSYPPEQAMAYQLVALAMKYLTGIESDFGWGPTLLSHRAISYYTGYESRYGDSWDAIHCPKLRIIKEDLPWVIEPVAYTHPPEQTAVETGMTMFLKRIEQARQLVTAITGEVDRLGMRLE